MIEIARKEPWSDFVAAIANGRVACCTAIITQENLYFDAAGAAGVLDWQSMRQGPWAHDLTYFYSIRPGHE